MRSWEGIYTGVFDAYAQFYDLLYREKNYPAEVAYIEALLKRYSTRDVTTVLDLGCGTGGHAFLLAEKGYYVTGVDRSEAMLAIAREKETNFGSSVSFVKGDIQSIKLHKKFDAVISMFAVMGYQTTNENFQRALQSSWEHLNEDGILIFDVWFGPAVIAQKPRDKILIIEGDGENLIRFTRPKLDIVKHIVDVDFSVLRIRDDQILDRVEETHTMRFFFPMELELFLTMTGYQMLAMVPFMEMDHELTEDSWDMSVVAKKV